MINLNSEVIQLVWDVFCLFFLLHPCRRMLHSFGVKRKVLGIALSPSCSLSWSHSSGLNHCQDSTIPNFVDTCSELDIHRRPLPHGPVRKRACYRVSQIKTRNRGNFILDGCLVLKSKSLHWSTNGEQRHRTVPPSSDLLPCMCGFNSRTA